MYLKSIFRLFAMMAIASLMFSGCGKPTDAEVIEPELEDGSGGYKVETIFQTTGFAQDVIKKDNLLYVAQGEAGLLILDVSNPQNPEVVSVTTEGVRGYSSKVIIEENVAYIASGTYGITLIDVEDPAQTEVTGWYLEVVQPSRNLYIMDKYLFTAISEKGVQIVFVEKPNQPLPDVRANVHTTGYAYSVVITPDTTKMMVACGELGLSIFDITDFQNGYGNYPLISEVDTPGYAEDVVISPTAHFAYMACGIEGLQIIDFSDTTNIRIVGSLDEGGYAKELKYDDNKIFMTVELGGLQVIDVADPTNPKLLGQVDTEFSLGLEVDDDYVYVADEDQGIIVISRPD
jgi:hypothetical protein